MHWPAFHHIPFQTKQKIDYFLNALAKIKAMKQLLLVLCCTGITFPAAWKAVCSNKIETHRYCFDSIKPLSLVTVRVLPLNNSVALQTVLSNEKGNYQLNKPDTGNYILSFTHTGFAEKQINILVVAGGDMVVDAVILNRSTGVLGEVVVKAQRPMVEQSDDKIVFNVEDDPTNKQKPHLIFCEKHLS